MKTIQSKFNSGISLSLIVCSVMLVCVLFNPIWKIDLEAPQYPEGLMMTIGANGLGGDVAIINGLNHYIGMKTLHNEDFIEFKVLPYIISGFALLFFICALIRNRKMLYSLFFMFVLFGVVAMVDFWKWEYDYGHNLDPTAAIVVPGMSYQPPLIGYKQLLNFGAYSVPAIGGWLFISAGVLLLISIIVDYRAKRKAINLNIVALSLGVFLVMSLSSCSAGPEPIVIGKDNCHFCKMTISDHRYGAEIITQKGKIYKYDELHCLLADISPESVSAADIKEYYLTDFTRPHGLVNSQKGFFLKGGSVKAPMGGDVAVFASADSLKAYAPLLGAEEVKWNDLISKK
jgi:copper chaperone NosL